MNLDTGEFISDPDQHAIYILESEFIDRITKEDFEAIVDWYRERLRGQ